MGLSESEFRHLLLHGKQFLWIKYANIGSKIVVLWFLYKPSGPSKVSAETLKRELDVRLYANGEASQGNTLQGVH